MGSLTAEDRRLLGASLPNLRTCRLDAREIVQYRECGPPGAAPVLFLHGVGSHSGGWRAVVAALSGRYRCIAWDAPGFGGSSPVAAEAPGAADYAGRLFDFATALGIETFDIVGSSWGSVVAMAAAGLGPDRIRRLALLVPNACLGGLPEADRAAVLGMLLSRGVVLDASRADLAAMLTTPDTDPEVVTLVGLLKEAVTEAGYAQAVRMMGREDGLSLATAVAQPALVLAGSEDRLAPPASHSAPIAAALPQGRLETLGGFGHLLKLESPARVADLVAAHFSA